MNTLQKFNIKEKMILGYMPIFFVIISIALFSLLSLHEFQKINKDIVENDILLVRATDKMQDNLLAQENYGRRYLILKSSQMLDLFWQRSEEFNSVADQVRRLPERHNIQIEKLFSLHHEYENLYAKNFEMSEKEFNRSVGYNDVIQEKLDEIILLIKNMATTGRNNQRLKMASLGEIGLKTFRIVAMLSLAGLLLGIFAVSVITRSISQSIDQLKVSARLIAEGKFDHFPDIHTKDEFRDLATSLADMAQRLSRLEEANIDSNPLTRLPGGTAIENVLKKNIADKKNVAFCMLDLDNFKSFNDRYGYAKGNDIIKATAQLIKSMVSKHCSVSNFVGHIGGDDFAVIVNDGDHERFCKAVVEEFDRMVVDFYNPEDRRKGYIVGVSRQGFEVRFPIMTISIAVVSTGMHKDMNYVQIGEIAAELKEHAKSLPGSVYVVNRRVSIEHGKVFRPQIVG